MFFFHFNFDNLKSELRDFVIDPKLEKQTNKARLQREEFAKTFPLDRLDSLSGHEIWDVSGQEDDFVLWITDRTSDVTTRLPWAKYNLGLRRNRYARYNEGRNREAFCKAIRSGLISFLISEGQEVDHKLEACLGKPLMLKLLYLYFPNQFTNIANVKWIGRITKEFALDYTNNVYEQSRIIRHFIYDNAREVGWEAFNYDKDFIVEYLGLNEETKWYSRYLTQGVGLSEDVSERYSLSLRQLSRMLVGFGIVRKSIFKLAPDELIHISGDFINQLKSIGWAQVRADRRARFFHKVEAFSEPLLRYVEFVGKLSPDEQHSLISVRHTFSVAGKRKREKSKELKLSFGCKEVDWVAEMQQARNVSQVVDLLQRSGSSRRYYRHYTTLSSFLCIADDFMFRLSRGDDPGMNDQLEWKRLGDERLWRRTFIASFSCVEGESAAMWGLYGKPANEALRLSIDSSGMLKWLGHLRETKDENRLPIAQFFGVNGGVGDKCELQWRDLQIKFGDVLYGGNISAGDATESKYIFRRQELNKKLFSCADETFERSQEITGFIKSSDWSYEEEARLVARLSDDITYLPPGKNVNDIRYVFLPVPQSVLSMVEYMKGPGVTAKFRPMFDEKLKSLFPTAILADSNYKDNLKFK